jgi:hypothetical protein
VKRGRVFLIAALVVSIVITGVVQSAASAKRRELLRNPIGGGSEQSLASMDSFALALLLGGMRGPLVMFLWMQSETSKTDKDLEGVETQIEWIRLLQPEFDTVHLFQIWNKAYNISVQMASLGNKYSAILDAMAYARNVEADRPDNINLLMAVANILHDKLSGSHEKLYYRQRVRQDTMYRAKDQVTPPNVRPTRYDSILDPQGRIRSEFLKPRYTQAQPATAAPGIEQYYDGSELQYLDRYAPFPYGVSPTGLAYNYFKRAQMVGRTLGQRHMQISQLVVDSRPALTLEEWSSEEWEVASRAEAQYLGITAPADRFETLVATAAAKPATVSDSVFAARKSNYDEALFAYSLSRKLATDSIAEMKSHLAIPEYEMHIDEFRSHMEYLAIVDKMLQADELFLKATRASGAERKQMLAQALGLYREGEKTIGAMRLMYFVDANVYSTVFPTLDRNGIPKLPESQIREMNQRLNQYNLQQGYDMSKDESKEYNSYVEHCRVRRTSVQQALAD